VDLEFQTTVYTLNKPALADISQRFGFENKQIVLPGGCDSVATCGELRYDWIPFGAKVKVAFPVEPDYCKATMTPAHIALVIEESRESAWINKFFRTMKQYIDKGDWLMDGDEDLHDLCVQYAEIENFWPEFPWDILHFGGGELLYRVHLTMELSDPLDFSEIDTAAMIGKVANYITEKYRGKAVLPSRHPEILTQEYHRGTTLKVHPVTPVEDTRPLAKVKEFRKKVSSTLL
jgi:hypothetical protein